MSGSLGDGGLRQKSLFRNKERAGVVRAFEVLSLRSQNSAGELSPYLKGIWLLLAVKGDVDVRANEGGGTLKSLPMLRAPVALASGLWSDHVYSKAERFAIHLQRG